MISLFSGIGGFELAGHNLGWDTVVQCEINPFCQQVLKSQPKWFYEALLNAKTKEERSCIRSKTFPGIAKAMASQYTEFMKSLKQ